MSRRSALASILAAAALATNGAAATGGARVARYGLDVAFDPPAGSLEATARIDFDAAGPRGDSVVFFLRDGLVVRSVAAGGAPVRVETTTVDYAYNHTSRALRTAAPLAGVPRGARWEVRYGGPFPRSSAGARSNYMRIDAEGVFLRSYGYSLWFPVFLEPAGDTYRCDFDPVVLRTPEAYTAVFVGTRDDENVAAGERVSVWRAPATDLFDAQCTARPYVRFGGETGAGVVVYALDDSLSRATAAEIASFAARLGSLYADRYAAAGGGPTFVIEMPEYGDIASGNVVGIQEERWRGFEPRSGSGITLAHELVHAHVGPDVPRSDPLYAFAVEGFPSYFHLPVLGEIAGGGFYDERMRTVEESYVEKRLGGKDRRGRALPPEKALLDLAADDIGLYKDRFVLDDRALLFFDDLRRSLGEARFREFTRDLFARKTLTARAFEDEVLRFLPEAGPGLDRWLRTTDYPVRLVP